MKISRITFACDYLNRKSSDKKQGAKHLVHGNQRADKRVNDKHFGRFGWITSYFSRNDIPPLDGNIFSRLRNLLHSITRDTAAGRSKTIEREPDTIWFSHVTARMFISYMDKFPIKEKRAAAYLTLHGTLYARKFRNKSIAVTLNYYNTTREVAVVMLRVIYRWIQN